MKTKRVRFRLHYPDAESVCVFGTFNEWRPGVSPMINVGNGRWAKELALPPGRYEYGYVIDGRFVADQSAQDFVPNVFGGDNSVVVVSAYQHTRKRRTSRSM